LCDEAVEYGFAGVCVAPIHVPQAVTRLAGRAAVVSVVGFPLGAGSEASDVAEAVWLVEHGASEIDMVIPIGFARAGLLELVTRRVKAVRAASRGAVLKVILETGYFEPLALSSVARAALEGEPDFLKTSTGFGPRGASVADIVTLRECGGRGVRIKASGGIRTLAGARELVAAGAIRLGTSSGVALIEELRREPRE
jgi:deoxyribose-phosphate aldolase